MDACGALFTSIMLGVILVQLESYIGIGNKVLYMLTVYVFGLFIYSTSIYFIEPKNWVLFLKIIALLNFSYCIITLFTVFQLQNQMTIIGKVYFMVEALLIAGIAILEWTYLRFNKTRSFKNGRDE